MLSPSDNARLTSFAREDLVKQCEALMTDGMSMRKAADELGCNIATLSRWRKDYAMGGREALVPGYQNCGRPQKFNLTEKETQALRWLHLEYGSIPLAVEHFPADPECQASTRALILEELDKAARLGRMPMWPQSLQRAARVTPEEKAELRGRKHRTEFELVNRRGMWWVDEDGTRYELKPNTIFESDDMSVNTPFRFLSPDTGKIDIGRQTLITQAVMSAKYLGVSPIGRERDAYRIEDIADHVSDIIKQHGLPTIWRFERGPWENQFIDGVKMEDGTRWGGLDGLFRVVHTFKSKGKGGIESSFDLLQKLMDCMSTRIGRSRGEFEQATKDFLKAVAGNPDAANKFWRIEDCADAMADAMQAYNQRPKLRRAFGRTPVVPDDLHRDAEIRPCPADQLWRLLPIKARATMRKGHIETVVPHYPLSFRFRVNGSQSGLYLEHGYSVLIAFHPGRPEEGCYVFNAETGNKNRDGYKFGELICMAPMSEDTPQVSFSKEQKDFSARKNAAAAVRSEFRGIVSAGTSQRRVSAARDGFGNAARKEDGITHGTERPDRSKTALPDVSRHHRTSPVITSTDRIAKLEREMADAGEILLT